MSLTTLAIVSIGVLFLLIFIVRMPIGFAMILVGFAGLCIVRGMPSGLSFLSLTAFRWASDYTFSVVPLFVLMGWLAGYGGLTKDAFSAVYKWIGHWRGGLAMSTVGASTAFGAVCGAPIAAAATMVPVTLPEMRRYRYNDLLSLGSIAAGGSLAFLIPPSLAFIIYAFLTEESVGALFMAGILPGLLLALLFMVTIFVLCRINPQLGPEGPRASWRERLRVLWGVCGILALFVLVLGGIYMGFFTPTEAAAVGAFGALVLGLMRRQLTRQSFIAALLETGRTTAMVFILIIGAMTFGTLMVITEIPMKLANFATALPVPNLAIIVAILMFYVLIGFIMEVLAVIMITIPIFYPLVLAMGFDPIWFGVVVIVTITMGGISPPVGIIAFVISGMVKEVPLFRIFLGCLPFLIAMFVCLIILIAFPQISLLLPNLMLPYR